MVSLVNVTQIQIYLGLRCLRICMDYLKIIYLLYLYVEQFSQVLSIEAPWFTSAKHRSAVPRKLGQPSTKKSRVYYTGLAACAEFNPNWPLELLIVNLGFIHVLDDLCTDIFYLISRYKYWKSVPTHWAYEYTRSICEREYWRASRTGLDEKH